jgi:hypothetical protein
MYAVTGTVIDQVKHAYRTKQASSLHLRSCRRVDGEDFRLGHVVGHGDA